MPDGNAQRLGAALAKVVGEAQVIAALDIGERYRLDITKKYSSRPAFLVRPATTEEVAGVVRLAAFHRIPVTVVGGQTGTVGSAVPSDGAIALSLERMNHILELDLQSMTMTVEAGCLLQIAQDEAEKAGALLPLDLGARGSAMIGGVIGTNAGGNRVLRWGMMRDMVIGLEAVLADGTVISSLTKMLKDNAGYNWKHLLIGSEGTLAVVTRAVLRLRPLPTTRQTALIAAASFEKCIQVLRRLEVTLSGRLSSFEVMWEDFYARMSEAQLPQRPRPLPLGYPIYALIEAMGGDAQTDDSQFERIMGALLEESVIENAVIANSERERQALWAVREDLQLGIAPMRPFRSYDVSMGVSDMPAFVDQARCSIKDSFPSAQMIFYGHAADGNLHAIVTVGAPLSADIERGLDTCIFDAVRDVNGSISAEHGIGVSRAPFLSWTRSDREIELMQAIKQLLDPHGILNPGKMIEAIGSRPKTS
jgi:FAD/FMN-containing dehydrogenase